ncbi:MAG: acyl-CoA thioesterase [Desulfobacteraceae bacterium]|nr:acyl-CoA thioesterase [Desulfobacteraceae bacterium]
MQTQTTINVRGYHIDHFGHVNNARYLEFLEEGRWHYCEKNNLLEELFHNNGIIHVVKQISIRYLKPAVAGNRLQVITGVEKTVRGKEIHMFQTIFLKDTRIKIADAQVINTLFCLETHSAKTIDQGVLDLWDDLNGSHKSRPFSTNIFPSTMTKSTSEDLAE